VQGLTITGRALAVFLDLPLLTGDETPWAPHVVVFANPWPGSVLVLRSASDADYTLDTALTLPAAIGETTADFASGPLWRWDTTHALRIRLYNGRCAARDDLAVLGGANALALQNTDGAWEVLQFACAELTAPGEWTLTRLLRGQAGTEGAMRANISASARVVLLDGALKQLALRQDEALLPFHYLWGPQGKPISDPAFQGATLAFDAVGLRPLSPVHLTACWQAAGDLVLAWIRRTRVGGDSWDAVPLGEETESYDVDILNADGAVVRSFASLPDASVRYAAEDIAADFPDGLPRPFRFTVYQRSASTGRGQGQTGEIGFSP
jgi:hypothetical protein